MAHPGPLASILLAAILAGTPAATAEGVDLSEGEIDYINDLGALAGSSRFCRMEWRPLYRALIRAWRESGRPEADVRAVSELFLQSMDVEEARLPPDFCPGSGQVVLDYKMEEALRQLAD